MSRELENIRFREKKKNMVKNRMVKGCVLVEGRASKESYRHLLVVCGTVMLSSAGASEPKNSFILLSNRQMETAKL